MRSFSRLLMCLGTAALLLAGLAPPARAAGGSPPAQGAPTRKITASKAFFTLDPFMISIVENYRVRGFLVLEVTLHLPARQAQDDAEVLAPRLRDSYVRLLMEYGAKIATITRPPDLSDLGRRLQSETDRVIGAEKGTVLLTQALVRPLS